MEEQCEFSSLFTQVIMKLNENERIRLSFILVSIAAQTRSRGGPED